MRLSAAQEAKIDTFSGKVQCVVARQPIEILPAAADFALFVNDQVLTSEDSKATVRMLRNHEMIELGESSKLEILPEETSSSVLLNLWRGALYFFSREKSTSLRIVTPHGTGAHRGTEFVLIVESNRTVLALIDGSATLSNKFGQVTLSKDDLGIMTQDKPPEKEPLKAKNIIQWWLYYPAVLDVDELELTPSETNSLGASMSAYRLGDLYAALTNYPGYPSVEQPRSEGGRIYLASLYLTAGQVGRATQWLESVSANSSLAASLRLLISAVQGDVQRTPEVHTSASEWLGLSYYYQARHDLPNALFAAEKAVTISKTFGFAWERTAELQFGFGRIREASAALETSLKLSPRNAQSFALRGFLLAAENRFKEARGAFEESIHLDSSLGNAWLGRGLVRIRMGDAVGGRSDLRTATILEPDRSLLRSYLGKAFRDAGDDTNAALEFARARELDSKDPTPWLYSALSDREENRINKSVENLERSIDLNDNRALFRSRFLLDEDLAVRSSSLAEIYRSAGMTEVSVGEAARSVSYDFGNYSAHQFLSESFDALRDPTRFNLRYETPWFNELLLADLLSPVGGTPLSQHISAQEYFRLFDRNRVGLISSTEYQSDGQVREIASQYGTYGNTSWSLDFDYQHNDGIRTNNDLDRFEWYTTIKQQLTPNDSVLLLAKFQDYHSGDNFQYFAPSNANPTFRYDEYQTPIIVGGYHHEWQPGVHSLLLGGRLEADQRFSAPHSGEAVISFDASGIPINLPPTNDVSYPAFEIIKLRNYIEIYTAEAQQIFENDRHALVFGARWQGGTIETQNRMANPEDSFPNPDIDTNVVNRFEWVSGYAYETFKLPMRLNLTAGFAYEHIRFPENFRSPPIQGGVESEGRFNPKAATVWDLTKELTVRGIYSRSIGGATLDESYRLEPAQLAGFSQSFRTVIPESLVGSVSAPDHEILGGALDLRLPTQTYLSIQAERIRSEVHQTIGLFSNFAFTNMLPVAAQQRLIYDETDCSVTVNQLLSDNWVLGAQYSFVSSKLNTSFQTYGAFLPPNTIQADLHRANLSILYNHPSGFFAQINSDLYIQKSSRALVNSVVTRVSDQVFDQLDFRIGYRFPRQRGEIEIGSLNLLNDSYHLNPVTPYAELPRKRVFVAALRFRL